MHLALVIIFVGLVIADTVLTYQVIREGKGYETMPMKYIIKYPIAAVAVTTLGTSLILELVHESGFYWALVLPIVALAYACWKALRILRGC